MDAVYEAHENVTRIKNALDYLDEINESRKKDDGVAQALILTTYILKGILEDLEEEDEEEYNKEYNS